MKAGGVVPLRSFADMDVAPLPGFAAPAGPILTRFLLFQAENTMFETNKKQPLRRARWLAGLAAGAWRCSSRRTPKRCRGALAKAYENNPTLTAARSGQRERRKYADPEELRPSRDQHSRGL